MSRPKPHPEAPISTDLMLQQQRSGTVEVQRLCVHTGRPPQDCTEHNGRCTTGIYYLDDNSIVEPEPLVGTLRLCGAIYAHAAHSFVFAAELHHCPGSS